mgnify:CR=1 FL=1
MNSDLADAQEVKAAEELIKKKERWEMNAGELIAEVGLGQQRLLLRLLQRRLGMHKGQRIVFRLLSRPALAAGVRFAAQPLLRAMIGPAMANGPVLAAATEYTVIRALGFPFVLPQCALQLCEDGRCFLACHLRWAAGGRAR